MSSRWNRAWDRLETKGTEHGWSHSFKQMPSVCPKVPPLSEKKNREPLSARFISQAIHRTAIWRFQGQTKGTELSYLNQQREVGERNREVIVEHQKSTVGGELTARRTAQAFDHALARLLGSAMRTVFHLSARTKVPQNSAWRPAPVHCKHTPDPENSVPSVARAAQRGRILKACGDSASFLTTVAREHLASPLRPPVSLEENHQNSCRKTISVKELHSPR